MNRRMKNGNTSDKPYVPKKRSHFAEVMKRLSYNKAAVIGMIILIIMVVIAALAPYISPYNYAEVNMEEDLLAPSLKHLFGTDHLGRDLFSRVLYGAKYSLAIGFFAMLIEIIGGVILGSVAGYFGGAADQLLMRICDVFQSIPGMILNIALSCVLGAGFGNTILALGIAGIPGSTRMMRASILKVREMEYIDASKSVNGGSVRIIVKHVLPNAFSPMIVQATMGVGSKILAAAGLSYLGLGVEPSVPEWGALLTAGRDYIKNAPYLTIIPGVCIMLIVLSLNLFGDGLRDALDPKLKK